MGAEICCHRCGYDRSGIDGRVACPECGVLPREVTLGAAMPALTEREIVSPDGYWPEPDDIRTNPGSRLVIVESQGGLRVCAPPPSVAGVLLAVVLAAVLVGATLQVIRANSPDRWRLAIFPLVLGGVGIVGAAVLPQVFAAQQDSPVVIDGATKEVVVQGRLRIAGGQIERLELVRYSLQTVRATDLGFRRLVARVRSEPKARYEVLIYGHGAQLETCERIASLIGVPLVQVDLGKIQRS